MINSYDDIKLYYDELRIGNIEKEFERRKKIYNDFPELKIIDNEIADTYTDFDLDTKTIKKKAEELNIKKEKFLKDNNIPLDYNDPIYKCKMCSDTGFVNGKKCKCYKQLEASIYNNIFDFEKIIDKVGLDKIDYSKYDQPSTKPPSGRDYKEYMMSLIKHIKTHLQLAPKEPFNAIFNGPTGVGKTFLAKAIGADAYKNGMTVLYIKATDYIDSFFNKNSKNIDELANSVDLLILDDLGKEATSDFSFLRMFNIIDKRLENEKSTVITTNYALNELREIYDDSIMSRVYNQYLKYRLFGDDLRSNIYE